MHHSELLSTAFQAAVEASKAIMTIYRGEFSADIKDDGSPVTIADHKANHIITQHLSVTGLPIISEESSLAGFSLRKSWDTIWIVDPLDGTKEFIKRNGEFTVNIALVEYGKPIMGVITAPAAGKGWIGGPWHGVYQIDNIYDEALTADPEQLFSHLKTIKPGRCAAPADNILRIAASRSHPDEHTERLINHLKKMGTKVKRVPRGSSLKLCEIAMGRADVYPRFGPTMEWDIAAGHAILMAAGGDIIDIQTGKPLIYNKADMLNPYFMASNNKPPEELLTIIRKWHPNPHL